MVVREVRVSIHKGSQPQKNIAFWSRHSSGVSKETREEQT